MALRKAIAWSVGGQALSYFVLFAGSVFVARLLTPRDMGIFAVAMATIAILNTLVAFNVGTYVVRAKGLTTSTLNSAFTMNAVVGIGISATILAFSVVEKVVFANADVSKVMLPLAVSPILGIFEFRPATMLQREMRFKILALIQTAKAFISTFAVLILAMAGYAYMSLPFGNVAGAIVGAVATNIAGREHRSFKLSFSEAREIMTFGVRLMSIGGIATIAARLADLILGQTLGLAALGIYSRASSISSMVFDNLYGAMTRVIFVRLADDARNTGDIRATFLRSFEVIVAILWPIQMGLAILAGPAIYYLYGERWIGAAIPLSLLMVAQCVVLGFGMNWELFVLKDETARQTKYEAIRAAVGIVFFTIGCFFNIAAAATARIAEATFGLILYLPHMGRLVGAAPGEIPRIIIRNLLLSGTTVAPAFILMMVKHWSYHVRIFDVLGSTFLSILIWSSMLRLLNHPLFGEIISAVRSIGRVLSSVLLPSR